jgi:hypothetical protein
MTDPTWDRLLGQARKGKVILLTAGAPAKQGIVDALVRKFETASVLSGTNRIDRSLSVEGKIPEETLRWIAAGELYEALVRENKVALLLSPGQNPCPDATWVYVSDLDLRKRQGAREYWEDMEAWIRNLPFDAFLEAETIGHAAHAPSVSYDPSDRAALRSVFADPAEKFVLVTAGPNDRAPAEQALRAAKERLARSGVTLRGAVSGAHPEALLPSIASIADAVVRYDASRPDTLLGDLQAAVGGRPSPATATKDLVLFNEWGIGDELLLSAVARELVKAHPDARVWIRSRFGFAFPDFARGEDRPPFRAQWVETIYQNPVLYGPQHHSPFPGHLVQQMLDKVCLDTGVKVEATDVRPELVLRTPGRDPNAVIVHAKPNPRLPSKDWSLSRWIQLCELLHAEGVRLRQVGAVGDPVLPHAENLCGVPVADLPSIVGQAGAVVTLVGFLMHLAEAVRTPAVVIYGGREHPAIDGYPDQVHLSSQTLPCRGRWGCHLAPDLKCPHGMKCMETITPELVAGETLRLLRVAEKVGAA